MKTVEVIVCGSIIAGKEIISDRKELSVTNPFTNEIIGQIFCATEEDVHEAVEIADQVFHSTMKQMPAYERSRILRVAADLLESRGEEFVTLLAMEAGKPVREGRVEVKRAVQVLRFASEGAKQIKGEQIPMDNAIGGEHQIGFSKRVPLGVVAAITPFNFPLNLALHKIAPAIAAGNTVVLKPAEKTPLTAGLVYKIFQESGLPEGAFNIIMGPGSELGEVLVTHKLVKKVTFTGSGSVGWQIKNLAYRKKVTLELGSNAPNIIFDDADLESAVSSIVRGGYTFAGQACVSVQRLYVQRGIYDSLAEQLVAAVQTLTPGDPLDEATMIGPMITEEAAIRAVAWVQEAVEQGADILCGGTREGAMVAPTILANVQPSMKVVCAEVFAPIVSLIPFDSEEEVIRAANDSEYGLQAGVFTNDINRGFRMADRLETGGVWINEVSVLRYDHMPYGGVKMSGIGKEGIQYAIEDMTDIKFIGINVRGGSL